ncbi:mitochondrial protein [Apiospora arundinis]|uniref:Mitochondrial protein n=1 Tax=Apiospora arundinis TaxID=335852 RepID=A0ABR2HYI5_9PEZI
MLPLASLAARRLRTPHHIYTTCRIASRSRGATFASPALHIQYGQSRLFSATTTRFDDNKPEAGKDDATDSKPTPPQQVKKKKKSTPPSAQQAKTPKAKKSGAAETSPNSSKSTPRKKKDDQTPRNVKVLQGALAALKNVLDAQNISVASPAKGKAKRAKKSEKNRSEEGSKPDQAGGDQQATEQPAGNPPKAQQSKDKPARTPKNKVKRAKLRELREALAAKASNADAEGEGEAQNASPTDAKKPKTSSSFVRKKKPGVVVRRVKHLTETDKSDDATASWVSAALSESAGADGLGATSSKKTALKKPLGKPDIKIENICSEDLHLVPIEKAQPPVPPVSYGLDRVLFNPGVYHLQDPRSRVFNFDPYLSKIMPIQEFDFNALKQYITSSKDDTLINIARENGKRYTGSTSSMTAMLAHFHYLLSSWRDLNTEILSKAFNVPSTNYTKILTSPAAVFLHWKDGVYAIDADKEFDTANILSMLGKSMEKLLTLSKEDYERYRTVNSDQISEEERNADEAYHYTGLGDFMMRSQLDAHDPRIPGTGMFDLKTRAVISIRMDAEGFHKGLGYEIRNRFGDWQSFEREYYDMIRSAFLKYSLQVRMGRMDGIFVAFHNTERIFGFQYIPLPEMDLSLHGTSNTTLGDKEFKLSLSLLNELMDRASKRFPEKSLRLHFETRPSTVAPFMYIFAKPVGDEEIKSVQEANKAAVDRFERKVLGLGSAEADESPAPDSEDAAKEASPEEDISVEDELEEALSEPVEALPTKDVPDVAMWEDVRAYVEDAMEDDELGVAAVREAIEDALEQSGLLNDQSPEETRAYVDSLLNALSPDASPEQTEGTIVDPDDAPESQDRVEEERSTSDDVVDVEASEESYTPSAVDGENTTEVDSMAEKPAETTDNAERDENDTSAQESQEDANAESDISSSETTSDSSVNNAAEEFISEISTSVEELDSVDLKSDQQEQAEELKDMPDTSGLSNLKDLIVRMAQSIDEREVSEKDLDEEDDSKLKEFERILGKMMADSKAASSFTAEANDVEVDGNKEPCDTSTEPSAATAATQAGGETQSKPIDGSELLGMVLTIRNRVNGSYVLRPDELDEMDKWDIEYNIQEMPEARAVTLYESLLTRRRKALKSEGDKDAAWYEMFSGSLEKHTNAGRKFREEEEAAARQRPVHVVGETESRSYEETFGKDETPPSDQDTVAEEPLEGGEKEEV